MAIKIHNNAFENVINPQVKRVKHSLSNKNIIKKAFITCIILIFYYSLSILLTFLNQRIFHVRIYISMLCIYI